jgi:hypothetical protein
MARASEEGIEFIASRFTQNDQDVVLLVWVVQGIFEDGIEMCPETWNEFIRTAIPASPDKENPLTPPVN